MIKQCGNLSAARWHSELNPWIDVVVICPSDEIDDAMRAIIRAMRQFWNPSAEADADRPYGDLINQYLNDACVNVIVLNFFDHDREDDGIYNEYWEEYIQNLIDVMPFYDLGDRA